MGFVRIDPTDNLAPRLAAAVHLYGGIDQATRTMLQAAFESEIQAIVGLGHAVGDSEAAGRAILRIQALIRATRWVAPSDALADIAALLEAAYADAADLDDETDLLFDDLSVAQAANPELSALQALALAAARLHRVELDV